MKKALLIAALLISLGSYAAQSNNKKSQGSQSLKIKMYDTRKKCADLVLIAQTYNCGAGFSGTYTIWLVADQGSGGRSWLGSV